MMSPPPSAPVPELAVGGTFPACGWLVWEQVDVKETEGVRIFVPTCPVHPAQS